MYNGSNNTNNFKPGAGGANNPFAGSGQTGAPSGAANAIFQKSKEQIMRAGPNTADAMYKPALAQYEQTIRQAKMQKQFAFENSQRRLSELREQLGQGIMKRQQEQANSGLGFGAQNIANAKSLAQEAGQTIMNNEQQYGNAMKQQNAQIGLTEGVSKNLVQGSTAMQEQTAQYLADTDNLTERTHTDNWLVHYLKGLGGYSSATNQSIDWDSVGEDSEVKDVLKQLGMDTTTENSKAALNKLVQAATEQEGSESIPRLLLNIAAMAATAGVGSLAGGAAEVAIGDALASGATGTLEEMLSGAGSSLLSNAARKTMTKQLASLAPKAIGKLTPKLASKLGPEALAGLAPEAAASLTPEAFAALAPEALSAITPEVAAALTPEVAASLTPEMLSSLAPEAIAQLSPKALSSLVPESVAGLSPEAIAGLSPEVLSQATPEISQLISQNASKSVGGLEKWLSEMETNFPGLSKNIPKTGAKPHESLLENVLNRVNYMRDKIKRATTPYKVPKNNVAKTAAKGALKKGAQGLKGLGTKTLRSSLDLAKWLATNPQFVGKWGGGFGGSYGMNKLLDYLEAQEKKKNGTKGWR